VVPVDCEPDTELDVLDPIVAVPVPPLFEMDPEPTKRVPLLIGFLAPVCCTLADFDVERAKV
jgi:hypothetical protein